MGLDMGWGDTAHRWLWHHLAVGLDMGWGDNVHGWLGCHLTVRLDMGWAHTVHKWQWVGASLARDSILLPDKECSKYCWNSKGGLYIYSKFICQSTMKNICGIPQGTWEISQCAFLRLYWLLAPCDALRTAHWARKGGHGNCWPKIKRGRSPLF